MAGLKIKEAKLVDELTEDCIFPISDGSGKPKAADFSQVKNFLGDTKRVESTVTNIQKKISYLTRNGLDSELSVKDIAEQIINPTSTNVETLIGNDFNKSVRTIASEVLAGASTGGGIDLDLYLSKSEAEATYEKKGVGYTKAEVDSKINEAVRINGEELNKKADKTTVDGLSASIDDKADKSSVDTLSERVDQAEGDIEALQTEQGTQKGAIQQQAQNIANLYADLGTKASQYSVDALASQISNKVEKDAYNTKVSALEASIGSKYTKPAEGIPEKDLAFKVATEEEVTNAIGVVATDLNNKIDSKVGTTDLKNLKYTVNEKSYTYNGLSEATMPQIFTPTTRGLHGQLLQSKGGSIPEWTNLSTIREDIGLDDETLAKINSIDNKFDKTGTLPAERVGGLSDRANGLASDNSIIANRIPYLKADAFAFLQPEDFTVEVAYDGITWETLDNNNADMRGMFAQWNFGTGFPIDGSNTNWKVGSKIRITLAPKADRNAKVDFVALNVYANGRTFDILTEYYDRSSGKEGWYSVGDQLSINSNGIGFVKYNQYFSFAGYARGGARFTFTITKNMQYGSKIVGISGFGNLAAEIAPTSINAPYTLGTLWYWDYLKNVYFPNEIYEGGTPLKNKYASITSVIQDIESANEDYITISTKGGTTVPTKVIGANTASINGSGKGLATAEDVRASLPTKLPNPEPLQYSVNGITKTYTGSSAANMQIFTPTEGGKQGQLLQSMGGGAPQWTNLSAIKEAIGFAKDLTGVLEATPEEFTYRPSAGNKSIRDEGAVIRRIKGNTTVWNQHIPSGSNPRAIPGDSNYLTVSIENSEWIGTVKNVDSGCNNPWKVGIRVSTSKSIVNHKYLICMNIYTSKAPRNSTDYFALEYGGSVFSVYPSSEQTEKWFSASRIFTQASDNSRTYAIIRPYWSYLYDYGIQNGDYYKVKDVMLFDLTLLFGAGNEPQTYEAFKAIYPDIYPYCEPTIRNVKTTAIETVGFNLFNGEYADLIGGKTYYVGGTGGLGLTFIRNGSDSVLNVALSTDLTFTPTQSGRLYSNNVNTCVHFQHSGIKDGECADYVKHTLELPEIAEYFHDGMNGIIAVTPEGKRDVYDEINSKNAIQRIGVVDIGELEWYTDSQKHMFLAPIKNAKPTGWNEVANAIMLPYTAVSRIEADTTDMSFCVNNIYHTPNRVCITNYNYEDAASFKAAMSGVYLYYELAEPEIRPILEPIQLVYDVEDFGTERAVSLLPSAPFRADIVYQFNAEGRIRDNGRNIERLENKIRSYHDDGAMVTIDREIITTKSIIGNSEFRYALPDAPQDVKDDADGTLATEFWVQKNIPTEVATAMMKESLTSPRPFDAYNPNIVYEFAGSLTELTIGMLIQLDGNYDHVWIIRFGCSSVINLSITPKVYWKDGIEPIFGDWGICELKFHTSPFKGEFLGEWKIYR